MKIQIDIPNWHPTPLNKLLSLHWGKASRLKKQDRNLVWAYATKNQAKPATIKRRLTLQINLEKGQRACDPDAYFKSTADALVHCGLLVDDNRKWVEFAPMTFTRLPEGEKRSTSIILEDMA